MQEWTDAWHDSNVQALLDLYAKNANVFPPNRPTLTGNGVIVDYFKGGFGKVDVYFDPHYRKFDGIMGYEFGEFRDVKWGTQKLTEKGKYSITWIRVKENWKIICHTFSVGNLK